jgi:hypothetical protein
MIHALATLSRPVYRNQECGILAESAIAIFQILYPTILSEWELKFDRLNDFRKKIVSRRILGTSIPQLIFRQTINGTDSLSERDKSSTRFVTAVLNSRLV